MTVSIGSELKLIRPSAAAQPSSLIPIRVLKGSEPAIIVPHETAEWLHVRRIERCEIYALSERNGVVPFEAWNVFWWTQLFRRDACFWPTDARSGALFAALILHVFNTPRRRATFFACRIVWSLPGDLDSIEQIETLWCRARK
jgi:hypothetical protein